MRIIPGLTISCFLLLLASCSSNPENKKPEAPLIYQGKKELLDLDKGMTPEKVRSIAGAPTKVDSLGTSQGSDGKSKTLVQWWYGKNQDLMFENGKLVSIVLDQQKQTEYFQYIMKRASDSINALHAQQSN